MSSSSSDSDDFEPIRRIKINIRPRDEVSRSKAADISEIKASVEAWRLLGPPRHPSPLTIVNHGDVVPIAIAIQEWIELIVRGHYDPNAKEPKFNSRFLGNIKVAFPNAFAKGTYGKPGAVLKLRFNSTENLIRYDASRLIKDLDLGNEKVANNLKNNNKDKTINSESTINSSISIGSISNISIGSISNGSFAQSDLFEPSTNNNYFRQQVEASQSINSSNSKVIEFDMDILMSDLRKMYEKSPNSRYYNVNVLRYQIAPIKSIQECPLQVCAYWKIEAKLIKLRVDFKHSIESGLNLERLREISFTVNFAEFIPFGLDNNNISTSNSIQHLTNNKQQQQTFSDDFLTPPYITCEPQAQWDSKTKQLIWKFDTLLPYHNTDGFGSLFAKIDFRNYNEMPSQYLGYRKPSPVDVKFLVIDSTLSKISLSIDSIGYKMSLLKKEIRSGRYRSEPYIMFS